MSANVPSPNPFRVAWSVFRAGRVRRPHPWGDGRFDHSGLQPVLDAVASGGVAGIGEAEHTSADYLAELQSIDPDSLTRNGSLAYWINAYNAAALMLARDAEAQGADSVLSLAGAFDRPTLEIAGEELSLNQVEHGKIRRFGDPRIHFALVCGSLSCPTLAGEPFRGLPLDDQLERRGRTFMASGGAHPDEEAGTLGLSRILLWYGPDFVRPNRMPAWLPATRHRVARAASQWLSPEVAAWIDESRPKIRFLPYDWGLGCSIR